MDSSIINDLDIKYQLEYCARWINEHNFTSVALQIRQIDLLHTPYIVDRLTNLTREYCGDPESNYPHIYVSKPSTCCVDLIVTRHITGLQAVIHIGSVCLSRPKIGLNGEIPTLYVFGRRIETERCDFLKRTLHELLGDVSPGHFEKKSLILYETSLIEYIDIISVDESLKSYLSFAKLVAPNDLCHFTPPHRKFIDTETKFIPSEYLPSRPKLFGHFSFGRNLNEYHRVIYIGNCSALTLKLSSPNVFIEINLIEQTSERVDPCRYLNRRICLVNRIKDQADLKVGVIITNPIPDVGETIETLNMMAKRCEYKLYFITMIQAIDECKVGNFDLCDAFVIVNSCFCSTILSALHFNRPILNLTEFKIVCGLEVSYGNVTWPGRSESSTLSDDDEHDQVIKRKVSDVAKALIQTRNELMERCSYLDDLNKHRWSGLEVNYGGDDATCDIQDGLVGIAGKYDSEPHKKD